MNIFLNLAVVGNTKTGVGRYSIRLLMELSKKDKGIHVYALVPPEIKLDNLSSQHRLRIFNYPFKHRPRWLMRPLFLLWNHIVNPFIYIKYKIDLVHYLNSTPILYRMFVPVVTTIHDTAEMSGRRHQGVRKLLRMWANRSAANKSDRLITVSHDAKNGIVNDLNISHNKVDVTYLAAGIECSNKCVNHQSPPFIFLHIGGSAKNKNLCRTIEAMRVIVEMGRQVELHVIGTVDRYSNESWIHYHGSIDDAKLANMYSKAFALLFLSTYEGFGIPILEAMSFGVVVVTTRMTSMPEIAKDCAIYVDPNDTADIVNGVCDLMDNTHIAEDLVKRSLIHTSTFSWQKCAHQTLETYYSAIKS